MHRLNPVTVNDHLLCLLLEEVHALRKIVERGLKPPGDEPGQTAVDSGSTPHSPPGSAASNQREESELVSEQEDELRQEPESEPPAQSEDGQPDSAVRSLGGGWYAVTREDGSVRRVQGKSKAYVAAEEVG